MGTISLQSESDQNQPSLNAEIAIPQQETNQTTRSEVSAEVTKLGELLCGNWTSFIRWYRFEWEPFFGCPMSKLTIDQLNHLHAELIAIDASTRNNAALQLSIRNHYAELNSQHMNANISANRVKPPYGDKFYEEQANYRSGGRTAVMSRLTTYELEFWAREINAASAVIVSEYRTKVRIIAARKSDGVTWVDGSLALDPKVLTTFPNIRLVAHETNKTATILNFTPISTTEITPQNETSKLDPVAPLLLASGKIEIVLLPARVENLATPAQRVEVQNTVKKVSSGVNFRVVIKERCGVDWNEYVTISEAQSIMAWAIDRLIEIPDGVGITLRELKTKVMPGRLHDYCIAVSKGLAADTSHLTLDELNEVLTLCGMPSIGKKAEPPVEFASDKERWLFLIANIFPLESGLKVDRMLCRANNVIPQTITRATRQQLEKYQTILIELAKAQHDPKPTLPAMSFGDGTKRRLSGKKAA